MYLSRLILDPSTRRVQREVADPYEMHRTLMGSFPDGLGDDEERVLYRLESDRRSRLLTLLVQSWHEPDWEWLAEPGARDYLAPAHRLPPGVASNPATKPFDLALEAGQVVAFRLRANPTVMRRFESGDHKRVGLYREEEQIEWLQRKGTRGGFRVVSVQTSGQEMVEAKIRRGKGRLQFLAVQFDGRLEVTAPEALHETVRQGIGSGKAFGFGLLSLAPR